MGKKLTLNLLEKLTSKIKDEYVEFYILTENEEEKIMFTIKSKPNLDEYLLIVNRTVDTINNLNDFRIELKKIIFYGFLLDTISNFPVPKISEDDIEIYDYSKLKLYLDKIDFEKQLRVIETSLHGKEIRLNLLSSIQEMEDAIDKKIKFHKEQVIHNSKLIKNAFEAFKSIPDMISTFGNSINNINQEDIKTLISAFQTLNVDGNLNELANNVVTSYLNKKGNENEDWIEKSISHEFY